MAFGPVGALVGGLLGSVAGGFIGSLFGDYKNVRSGVQVNHYVPGGRGHGDLVTGISGTRFSTFEKRGDTEAARGVRDAFLKIDETLAGMLGVTATLAGGFYGAKGKEHTKPRFYAGGIEVESMEAVVNQFVKDWFRAVEGEIPASVSRLVAEMDRTLDPEQFLNSIQAFVQLQQLVAGISLTLTEIAAGHGAQRLREGLDLLDKGVDRALRDFSAAAAVGMGDLVELNRAAQAVHQAVIQRYQTETQLATELYQRVNQLRQAAQAWEFGLLERLQGSPEHRRRDPAALATALAGHYRALAGELLGTDPTSTGSGQASTRSGQARRLALLEEGLATLDQWLEASLQTLTEQQRLSQAAADERISALQDELQLAQAWTGVLNQARALLERLTLTAASPLPGSARLGGSPKGKWNGCGRPMGRRLGKTAPGWVRNCSPPSPPNWR